MADKPAAQARLAFDKIKQVSSSAPGQTSYLSSSAIAPSSTSSSFAASASSTFTPIHRRPSYSCTPSRPHIMDKPHASMAPPPPPMLPMQSDKPSIASLMSPPDASLDSFRHAPSAVRFVGRSSDSNGHGQQSTSIHHQQQQHQQQQQQQPLPMSPPISPYSKLISATGCTLQVTLHSHIIKDPVLYPVDEHSPASPPAQPLFAPAELEHHQRIVDDHVRARSHSIFGAVAPPRREDYELALTFRSQVMKHYTADRKGWLRKERALLEADRRAGAQRYHAIMPAKPIAAKLPKQRVDRVSKSYAASRPIRTNTTNTINTTTTNNNNNNNNSGSSNKNNVTHPNRPAGRTSPTPEPSRRVVAPNREDKDFNSIVNYCPPLNTLPERANSLKVDWKGQPIDLSSDAHAHLLHPDELLLAGNLRLDCATYLTSKRRIFERRLQCLRTGKEFRKTDAQQACKIDVNKASKLWTAFEKVGWLKASWVSQFL